MIILNKTLLMMKGFTTAAVLLLIAGTTFAQEPKKKDNKPAKAPASCVKGDTKGKSCCQQPSKTASLRMAAAKPAVKKEPAKPATR